MCNNVRRSAGTICTRRHPCEVRLEYFLLGTRTRQREKSIALTARGAPKLMFLCLDANKPGASAPRPRRERARPSTQVHAALRPLVAPAASGSSSGWPEGVDVRSLRFRQKLALAWSVFFPPKEVRALASGWPAPLSARAGGPRP